MYELDADMSNATLFEYSGVPYHRLGTAFRRVGKDDDEEEYMTDLCNYWFLPYDVIDEMIMLSSTPLNRVHTVAMDLTWDKGGYKPNKHRVIRDSTGTVASRLSTKHL